MAIIVYVNVHGKVKCPTLGPASSVKTPWYPLVLRGRGIVGHAIDRCITMELNLCQKYNRRCKLLAPHLVHDTASAFHRPHPTIAYFDVRIPLLMHLRLSRPPHLDVRIRLLLTSVRVQLSAFACCSPYSPLI